MALPCASTLRTNQRGIIALSHFDHRFLVLVAGGIPGRIILFTGATIKNGALAYRAQKIERAPPHFQVRDAIIGSHQFSRFLAQEHVGIQMRFAERDQLAGGADGHHRRRFFRHVGKKIRNWHIDRAIAYEKFGRWFDAEEPLLRAKERTDAGSSPFRHPRSELIAPLLQEAPSAFNNRKLHMRLPWAHRGPWTGRTGGWPRPGWRRAHISG